MRSSWAGQNTANATPVNTNLTVVSVWLFDTAQHLKVEFVKSYLLEEFYDSVVYEIREKELQEPNISNQLFELDDFSEEPLPKPKETGKLKPVVEVYEFEITMRGYKWK